MLMYDSEPALYRSCCRSSKQDGSVSLGTWQDNVMFRALHTSYVIIFAGCPRTGDAAQDVHVTPWKQTFIRSTTD